LTIKKADRIHISLPGFVAQPAFLIFLQKPKMSFPANTSTVHFGFAKIIRFITNLSEIKSRATDSSDNIERL
jgi:hypothetical protein